MFSRKMEYDTDIEVSIFPVPMPLKESNPEAYVPQLISLGPYHNSREVLKPMHTFKLGQIDKIKKKRFSGNAFNDFNDLIHVLQTLGMGSTARASYASPIDMEDYDLVHLMASDSLYLLELLRRYVDQDYNDRDGSVFFRDLVTFGTKGNKSPWEIAAGDAMMLENQIPIRLLKLIVTAEHWDTILPWGRRKGLVSVVTENLPDLVLRFVTELSPLSVFKDYPFYKVLGHSHLLELLYRLVTLKTCPEWSREEEAEAAKSVEKIAEKFRLNCPDCGFMLLSDCTSAEIISPIAEIISPSAEIISPIWNLLLDTVLLPLKIPSKIIQGLIKLPWSKICLYISSSNGTYSEILIIPGASELRKKGVALCPIDRISDIKFDKNTLCFQVPWIKLDQNSEIVLRNLVAYEAAVTWGDSLVLARYLELMGGLGKTCDDVKTLIDSAIIQTPPSSSSSSSLKEEEVLELFAVLSKPVKATNAKFIDEAFFEVICYYNGLPTVRAQSFVKKWGFIVLRWCSVLGVLLALLVLIFMAIRSLHEWLFINKDDFLGQLQLQGIE